MRSRRVHEHDGRCLYVARLPEDRPSTVEAISTVAGPARPATLAAQGVEGEPHHER